jgi:hypothetical protein
MERHLYSWFEWFNIVKMLRLPNIINRFHAIPIKILMIFFTEIERAMLKWNANMKPQRTTNSQNNLDGNNNKPRGITLLNFKTYHKATVVKAIWYQLRDRHKDHWNIIGHLELSSYISYKLIIDKGAKNTQWRRIVSWTASFG